MSGNYSEFLVARSSSLEYMLPRATRSQEVRFLMNELVQVRPKLKQDSVFLQTDDGVFLRSDETTFLLRGKSVYRWISILSPYMTGEYTIDQLCDGLEPAQRDTVVRLVNTLLQRGVLKNHLPEAPGMLPDEVRKQFNSQIEFIEHYADRPQERFKTFRESRVLLVGSGEAFTALATSLIRNGLRELFLAPTDGSEAYLKELEPEVSALCQHGVEIFTSTVGLELQDPSSRLGDYDIVAYCSDGASLKDVFNLNQRCIDEGRAFLPAIVFGGQAMIGPFVKQADRPCWLCLQMRLSANTDENRSIALWRELTLGDILSSKDATFFTSSARRLGNGLSFELFKLLAGHLPSETEKGVIIQDLETLESHLGILIQHPLCPSCSHFDLDIGIHRLLELVTDKRDHDLTTEDLFHKSARLLDPDFGIFNHFADEEISQVPLKVARLRMGSFASPIPRIEVTAYGVENLLEARRVALTEAVIRYTKKLPDSRGMVFASFNEMLEKGKVAISAQELSIWSGGLSFEENVRHEWLPAFSLSKQRLCYVPAAAIYPHSSLNRLGIFEKTLAGSVAGLTFRDTLTAGILSMLGYECLRDILLGHSSVIALNTEMLESFDPNLAFVIKSAKHFERAIAMLEVLHEAPFHVTLTYTTDDSAGPISAIGIGLSGPEAASKALLNLVGGIQLFQFEGKLPAKQEELFPGFSLPHDIARTNTKASRFKEPATTLKQLEDYLLKSGRDILFANNTTTDIWDTETLISATVLLTRALKTD
jgi:putative thiazole-containing bacteriocin maturation protein